MLAVMESNPESTKDPVTEFLVTGRTGRRNAMADILGPNASVTSGDLPERLQSLTTMDSDGAGPSANIQMEATGTEAEKEVVISLDKPAVPKETLTKPKSEVES